MATARVPLKYGSEEGLIQVSPRRTPRLSRWTWVAAGAFIGVNVLVLGGIVLVGSRVNDSLTQLQSLQAAQAAQQLSIASLPPKFAVQYVTPRQDQARRGTCWDFSTIALLEWSYREHGVRNGWLAPDEYVAFSEQAYGIEIMKLCTGEANSPQQKDCRVGGDFIWNQTTEGGENYDVYYLKEGLKESVLPISVCPYTTHDGNNSVCPGLDAALATNPIKFDVRSMDTYYDDLTIKREMFRQNKAMALSTPVATSLHYYPCIGPFLKDPHCQLTSDKCMLCPSDMAMTTCCVPAPGSRNPNMEGEFYAHRGLAYEGGHAMHLVGYNDAFLNHEGEVGGFILKNSWADGPSQGSHTLKYWLQDISDWEERTICPNSYNPTSWYMCGNADELLVTPSSNGTTSYNKGIEDCLSATTQEFAKMNVQPLELACTDSAHCLVNADTTYFVRNTTDWGDRMTLMCVWEYNQKAGTARDYCLLPMLESQLARTLRPKTVRENDTDRCGFYFISYDAVRRYATQFGQFFVNSFDIVWDDRSFVANKAKHPAFDYSLLTSSTRKQHHDDFTGPHPFAELVASFPNKKA
ncbi:hypothetical protein SPRG_11307 [Saprolegnia parasitica CBS 223.65]|uniref:Peptidase C1A papain C-terminal domain-containing protein n=1 Tax=Saprolegnia parasitica (strain CBS 223.65) TaxID=695850 RepID=A0A067BZS4_SAPPC|nr:hypothetical protein SPRG_11307 [Saprolegnia parasitica CBS 223.65]KDO22355.1 hypothetical protein SPRG_11307 [Saprolegnia parasitica CBS 223.65]|eukprot:XP_012206880.1 hypothetical protein SPRG_11307 [Saprolegnia parasitica CBS 223.65]